MRELRADPGSFRDPAGHVFHVGGRVFRTVAERAAPDYEFLRRSGFLRDVTERGWYVGGEEVDPGVLGGAASDAKFVVEHPPLPFVSYPYEWSFAALKSAALLHLDLHRRALDYGVTLSDASAYNVQFLGPRPVFIDLLSLRRYRDGEFWVGHRQFCEQFLNPLLLRALRGISHNAWFRGSLEGITAQDLRRILSFRHKLSWNVLSHVVLQARFQSGARAKRDDEIAGLRGRRLPLGAFRGMLEQMRSWILALEPARTGASVWGDYAETHTYSPSEAAAKHRFVAEFAARVRPGLLWDLGCNTGEYAETALASGAERVVGFDFDQDCLDAAFARARERKLDLLPLFLDAANPSPDQGWGSAERMGLAARARAGAILALAFEHHLAIGRNVPLDQVVSWLVGLAPAGVIEFVQKSDPTVRKMLLLREDVFEGYSEVAFANLLGRHARIVRSETVSEAGRVLYWYERP